MCGRKRTFSTKFQAVPSAGLYWKCACYAVMIFIQTFGAALKEATIKRLTYKQVLLKSRQGFCKMLKKDELCLSVNFQDEDLRWRPNFFTNKILPNIIFFLKLAEYLFYRNHFNNCLWFKYNGIMECLKLFCIWEEIDEETWELTHPKLLWMIFH